MDAMTGRNGTRDDEVTAAVQLAAAELFRERSYAEVTIREIAQRAGVNERTLYRRFGSKEELVLAEVRGLIPHLGEELLRRPAEETPLVAIREAFRAVARTGNGSFSILVTGSPLIGEADSRRAGALLASFETALSGFLLDRYASDSFTPLKAAVISRSALGALRAAVGLRLSNAGGALELDRAFDVLRHLE
jgi:AcrR family transcriptional regulator